MNTHPEELVKFHAALMSNAPEGYVPWYFPVNVYDKDPDSFAISQKAGNKSTCCQAAWVYNTKKGYECSTCKISKSSWKAFHARLTYDEAIQRLKDGGNVGISARVNDKLIICDIDKETCLGQLLPTLTNKSRKRTGRHGYYWAGDEKVKTNITTDTSGELRSADQYVLAAGSFVTLLDSDIDKAVANGEMFAESANKVRSDPMRGVYTVENEQSPTMITWEQLPKVYRDEAAKTTTPLEEEAETPRRTNGNPDYFGNSKLFQLTMNDILPDYNPSDRLPHPLHSSDTGKNFSISNGLGHCWRHLVSLNPIQYLCIKAGYASCNEAGTPHGGGTSQIKGDKGAILYAWRQAQKDGLVPSDDKIPLSALWYIAFSAGIVPQDYQPTDWAFMPDKIYQSTTKYAREAL